MSCMLCIAKLDEMRAELASAKERIATERIRGRLDGFSEATRRFAAYCESLVQGTPDDVLADLAIRIRTALPEDP